MSMQNGSYVKNIQKSRSFSMHSSKKEGCNRKWVMLQYLSVTDTCLFEKDTYIQMYFQERQCGKFRKCRCIP